MSQNAILPAGFRQRDQTKKSPTGAFDRDALQEYLEKQALEHEDREDLVPFTGEKKGSSLLLELHSYQCGKSLLGRLTEDGLRGVSYLKIYKVWDKFCRVGGDLCEIALKGKNPIINHASS